MITTVYRNPDPGAPNGKVVQTLAAATAAALCGTAAVVAASAHQTERRHPSAGRFVDVAGVRVHYIEEGSGPPLALIHGNAMSAEDFVASGIVGPLAQAHRVLIFDRPGFGYSERPRGTDWTPIRQAELIHQALETLDVRSAIVVGHSLGSLVAVALGLAHPADARALVLLSGYYYATVSLGMPLLAASAAPVLNDVMRFTAWPISARLMEAPAVHQMFAPAAVTDSFASYPLSMSRRPSQLRATVEDANYIYAAAKKLQGRYGELTMPVEILAGDGDMIVDTWSQSRRLARALPDANFNTIQHAGHMIQHIAPERVVAAIAGVETRLRKLAA